MYIYLLQLKRTKRGHFSRCDFSLVRPSASPATLHAHAGRWASSTNAKSSQSPPITAPRNHRNLGARPVRLPSHPDVAAVHVCLRVGVQRRRLLAGVLGVRRAAGSRGLQVRRRGRRTARRLVRWFVCLGGWLVGSRGS